MADVEVVMVAGAVGETDEHVMGITMAKLLQ